MSIRTLVVGALALTLVGAITGAGALSQGPRSEGPGSRPLVTQAEYDRWQTNSPTGADGGRMMSWGP